jgi:hypothetical protein
MAPGQDSIAESDMLPPRQEDRNDRYSRRYRNEDRYQEQDRDYGDRYEDYDRNERDQDYDRPPQYDPQRPSERYRKEERNRYPEQQRQQSDRRTLSLQVQPSDATIYIDGNYYGTSEDGHVEVMLPDGMHKIEVVRPGYESFTKDVLVGPNAASSMTIMLEKK